MQMSGRSARVRPGILVAIALALATVSACSAAAPAPTATRTAVAVHPEVTTSSGVRVIPGIEYGRAGGQALLLDACLPTAKKAASANPAPHASIVMIHGGSWTRGDKAEPAYRAVCEWLARNGYPTLAIDYRMDPQFV